ncbi:PLP-dependent transferase [Olsenella sp. YH-ols2217]|uniref:PLP-dependent transferase n=1 Tax=Kribbibacterium absianum TaxID=3044210 RepID=A0ABT6ZM70_9ACTN|nr:MULTISPECIES: PLP-dependent transferase [unclassified Olsenella]MDJ1121964.1 PLP-dependent transferase [Olsenella sp. YH-ols2216]MDJ1129972.1 PLP-dependent transferase [Olsenella sp. YH-ols2217]
MDTIDVITQTIGRWLGKRCARTWLIAQPADTLRPRLATVGHVSAPTPSIDPGGLSVTDLKAAKGLLAPGECLWVENSLAGPVTCPACVRGADLVTDDLETFLGPNAPLTAVSVSPEGLRNHELTDILNALSREFAPGPSLVAVLGSALESYDARQHKRCDNAQVLAEDLACHPAVARTLYPGLKQSLSHDVAARVLEGGFGASVELVPAAEEPGAIVGRAAALQTGGQRTVSTRVMLQPVSPADQERLSLPPFVVRVVCGDEEALALVMWAEPLLGAE